MIGSSSRAEADALLPYSGSIMNITTFSNSGDRRSGKKPGEYENIIYAVVCILIFYFREQIALKSKNY